MQKNDAILPAEFKSIEEIQEFWDENSSADFWDQMEDVELDLSPELRSELEIRKLFRILGISPDLGSRIKEKARAENKSGKQLIRKWILERV